MTFSSLFCSICLGFLIFYSLTPYIDQYIVLMFVVEKLSFKLFCKCPLIFIMSLICSVNTFYVFIIHSINIRFLVLNFWEGSFLLESGQIHPQRCLFFSYRAIFDDFHFFLIEEVLMSMSHIMNFLRNLFHFFWVILSDRSVFWNC